MAMHAEVVPEGTAHGAAWYDSCPVGEVEMNKKTERSEEPETCWTVGKTGPALFIMCLPAVACDVEPPATPKHRRKKRGHRAKKRAS
jgi:hypothetical protein